MQHILFSRLQINRTVIVLNVFCHNMWVTINQIKTLKCQIHTRCVLICTFHSQSFRSMHETSWQSNWLIWCRAKKNFAPLLKIESKKLKATNWSFLICVLPYATEIATNFNPTQAVCELLTKHYIHCVLHSINFQTKDRLLVTGLRMYETK